MSSRKRRDRCLKRVIAAEEMLSLMIGIEIGDAVSFLATVVVVYSL